jgi:hypothetical protein
MKEVHIEREREREREREKHGSTSAMVYGGVGAA